MASQQNNNVVHVSAVTTFPINGDNTNKLTVLETDPRDGQTVSPSTGEAKPVVPQQHDHVYELILVPQDVASTVSLITALNKSNFIIFQQNERVLMMENDCQTRSPPGRHRRPDTRSPSPQSRSPPQRHRRDDARSISPRQEHQPRVERSRHEKTKKRGRTPPRRDQLSPDTKRNKITRKVDKLDGRIKKSPRRSRSPHHSLSPQRSSSTSDEDDARGPLCQEIMDTRIPRGL